jgi:hypothetical protein
VPIRSSILALAAAAAFGCQGSTDPLQPLDGVWQLDSATVGLPPRQMTLVAIGSRITGAGTAMGVDVPIPIAISGTATPSASGGPALVSLHFTVQDGGGVTGDYTGTLDGADRLTGSATWYGIVSNGPVTGQLSFSRLPNDTLATGLEGTVTRGPITPVCRVGVPCDAPFSATFTVFQASAELPVAVAHFQSDTAGRYEVLLVPGSYTIVPDSTAPVFRGQSRTATVEPTGLTHLDFQFDTGIR